MVTTHIDVLYHTYLISLFATKYNNKENTMRHEVIKLTILLTSAKYIFFISMQVIHIVQVMHI